MITPKEFDGGINGIPQFQDWKGMWENLRVTHVETIDPAISVFTEELKKYYLNGEVKYHSFILPECEVLDWYCSRNQLKELHIFKKIWSVPEVKQHFNINEMDENPNKAFNQTSPFTLGGSLAWILHAGGAYEQPKWNGKKSKAIGEKAAVSLINDDYENTLVYESGCAWCDLFYDVAWDSTFIVLNKKERQLHILTATDTDY